VTVSSPEKNDKQTAKFNPFLDRLRYDEELVWMNAPQGLTVQEHIIRTLKLCGLTVLVIVGVSVVCLLPAFNIMKPDPIAPFIQTVLLILGLALAFVGLVSVIQAQRDANRPYTYALTTQRLISIARGEAEMLNVDEIKSLYITGDNEQASITFLSARTDAYTWDEVGECDVMLHRLQKLRETPIKVMRL
jgi:hypothetical protein